jgi:hypothetical protein
MTYNLYWLEDGERNIIKGCTLSFALELAKSILEDGGEITGIINSEDDQ